MLESTFLLSLSVFPSGDNRWSDEPSALYCYVSCSGKVNQAPSVIGCFAVAKFFDDGSKDHFLCHPCVLKRSCDSSLDASALSSVGEWAQISIVLYTFDQVVMERKMVSSEATVSTSLELYFFVVAPKLRTQPRAGFVFFFVLST